MKYEIKEKTVKDLFELFDDLEEMLTDKISELHKVKGHQTERHAFSYYRKLLWESRYLVRDNIKEIETPKK